MSEMTYLPINMAFQNVVPGVDKAPSAMTLPAYESFTDHPFLPTKMADEDFLFDKQQFQLMSYAWNREWNRKDYDPRRGVWWGGPKGAGKTTLTEQFFARLGVPVVQVTCNRRVPLSDLIDKMVPDGAGGWLQVPGPLKIAMLKGFPVILNEPSRMEPADLVAMHDIIDRGMHVADDGEVVKAARGFVVFATDNTMGFGDDTGSYPDANLLDQATMSRFLKGEVSYPSIEHEVKILVNKAGVGEDVAKVMVAFATSVRSAYMAGKSAVTMGTRELIDWAQCTVYFKDLKSEPPAMFALKSVLGGCNEVEMRALRSTFESHFGVAA